MATDDTAQLCSSETRRRLLMEANTRALRQALSLLEQIDDRIYSDTPPGFGPHRAGGHLRHIVEFYECFLSGVRNGVVDYDARKRDRLVEINRQAAQSRIRRIIRRLEENADLSSDASIRVRIEDSGDAGGAFVTSTPARELQVLASHTIHHFALIAMTLTAHGVAIDSGFGMAPSTLRHRAAAGQHRGQAA
jgi:uncharacterized damage-inducible protein DinB